MARYADTMETIPRFTGKGHAPARKYNIAVLCLNQKIKSSDIKLNKRIVYKSRIKELAGLILQDLISWSRAYYVMDPESEKKIYYRYSEEEYVWKTYSNYLKIGEDNNWSDQQVKRAYKFLREAGFLVTRIRIKDHSKERLGLTMILQPSKISLFLDKIIDQKEQNSRCLESNITLPRSCLDLPSKRQYPTVETTDNISSSLLYLKRVKYQTTVLHYDLGNKQDKEQDRYEGGQAQQTTANFLPSGENLENRKNLKENENLNFLLAPDFVNSCNNSINYI